MRHPIRQLTLEEQGLVAPRPRLATDDSKLDRLGLKTLNLQYAGRSHPVRLTRNRNLVFMVSDTEDDSVRQYVRKMRERKIPRTNTSSF
jgi:hypothetical protein